MPTALTANGHDSPPSQLNGLRLSDRNLQQPRAVTPPSIPAHPPASHVTPQPAVSTGASTAVASPSSLPPKSPSLFSVPENVPSHVRRVSSGAKEGSAAPAVLAPPAVTLSPLSVPSDDAASSSAACALISTPASSAPRVRIPLSSVVTSLTQKWSTEYLKDAEAGDVEAMCLVAQMYCEGWGALQADQQEGKRWLERAKAATGNATAVTTLEGRYLDEHGLSDEAADRGARPFHSRHEGAENGYFSGYAHTPLSSPSQVVAVKPGGHGFFAGVAQAISPKPAAPSHARESSYAASLLARSLSHDQLQSQSEAKTRDLLPSPDISRRHSNGAGSGSGSGEEAHNAAQHQLGNTHALMVHGFWKRGHAQAAQSEVSAN